MDFSGSALALFGWMVLSAVGALAVIPLAWVSAAVARWFCSHTKFSDGTTAEFRGTGDQVVIWHILFVFVAALQQFLLAEVTGEGWVAIVAVILGPLIVQVAIVHTILKWFFYNVKLSTGPDLAFTGSYGGLLGWYIAAILGSYTILGWAWVVAAWYRWMAEKVKGKGVVFSFHAKGWEILWRTVAWAVASCLIVTIPWTSQWFTRWLIQNIQMSHKDELDISQLAD